MPLLLLRISIAMPCFSPSFFSLGIVTALLRRSKEETQSSPIGTCSWTVFLLSFVQQRQDAFRKVNGYLSRAYASMHRVATRSVASADAKIYEGPGATSAV